jgi:hypothetical protein
MWEHLDDEYMRKICFGLIGIFLFGVCMVCDAQPLYKSSDNSSIAEKLGPYNIRFDPGIDTYSGLYKLYHTLDTVAITEDDGSTSYVYSLQYHMLDTDNGIITVKIRYYVNGVKPDELKGWEKSFQRTLDILNPISTNTKEMTIDGHKGIIRRTVIRERSSLHPGKELTDGVFQLDSNSIALISSSFAWAYGNTPGPTQNFIETLNITRIKEYAWERIT